MRSDHFIWLDRTTKNRRHTTWNRAIRMAALFAVVVIGEAFAALSFSQAGSLEDRCFTVDSPVGADPRLGWLAQRLELDRQTTCLRARLSTMIAMAEERTDATEGSASTFTPVPSSLRTARLLDGQRPDRDGRETEPIVRSEEIVIDDEFFDPFEEQAEPINDPWERFNTRTFEFNRSVDRYVFKPIATGYDWLLPDPVEEAIGNLFDNVRFVPRFVNNLAQAKGKAAATELGRFLTNSTVGLAGLFDVAQAGFGLAKPEAEDTGQTLAVYDVQSGPYLVLPFLPPTTVRDGVGFLGDLALDPLNLLLPFGPQIATRASQTVNDRSENLDRFEGVEEGTLDLYAAVRDAYLQTRSKAIRE